MIEKAQQHLWYGPFHDKFYVGKSKLSNGGSKGLMQATGDKHEIPEGDVVGAFKAWLMDRQGERVEFVDGVIQWVPKGEQE